MVTLKAAIFSVEPYTSFLGSTEDSWTYLERILTPATPIGSDSAKTLRSEVSWKGLS